MSKEEFKYNAGERLSFLRKQRGWSINKLATIAGVSQSHLRDVELGRKNPTVDFIFLVCTALDITLYDFFQDTKMDSIDDPLNSRINLLSKEQKQSLLTFLNTLI